MNQLEIHKTIEEFFKTGIDSANIKIAQELLVNEDAKRFFFSQADSTWIDWLWQNGFLDELKNKSKDTTYISYHLPELDYLTRMAKENPIIVTKIMLDKNMATREDNFNPEVINGFLWVMTILPTEQIKLLTAKIRDEKWVYLMRAFRKTGHEFDRIVKKLVEAKENDAILELAQALLVVRDKNDATWKTNNLDTFEPFYMGDINTSGIFEALVNISDAYKEKALQVTVGILGEIVKLAKIDKTKVFDYTDLFALYDVDIFTLEVEDKRSYSYRKDVRNLTATIKKLIETTIGKNCIEAKEAKRLFDYISQIPLCKLIWRLKLFALAQCPETFKNELKEAFFKLFSVENYYDIEGGTEYKKALKIGFSFLSNVDQREYVKNVISYFSQRVQKDPDKVWIKRIGWEILSSIPQNLLIEGEKVDCEKLFGNRPDQEYEPEPPVRIREVGFVNHKSPVNLDDFTIDQIIENLETEWTIEKLNEQFENDDFLNPRDIEGLGNALKENIKKRTNEYLKKIDKFFNRDRIHPQYIYSLLCGIEEMLRDKQLLTLEQVGQLFNLFGIIRKDGEVNPFKRRDDKSWLIDWVEVHKVINNILFVLVTNKDIKGQIQKVHREQLKDLISYLLSIKDSPSKENEKSEYSEPYYIAINSVRGRAYETFVVFTENDGEILADDVKEIYKKVLLDNSLAVHFVIGRYLASFYFRDKEFIGNLFSEIFPKDDSDKKDIYLASWEGYLSNTLYDELFAELKDYYSYAITLNPKDYTQRKYSKGLDESLAVHIALAFVHLGLDKGSPLFAQFWSNPNIERHQEFISFIGRSCLTRDQVSDEWLIENKISKDKLIEFWDWALKNVTEPEVLAGFGFWVNPNKEVLDENVVIERMAQTLNKSGGNIDWDYGLMRRLLIFAEKNGEKTLEIILHFLLDSKNNLNQNHQRLLFNVDSEIKQALDVIYKNGDDLIKQRITDLIGLLIEKGSNTFWGLKDIIK